ncbi:hypothetical protein TcWFU_009757 [Taenia crassiceps]|uniref:PH domain-containing protein n=1 Tax=Taenia crassiceps TaxID=6207 RepID=A0ABR4QIR4_9CEST
MLAYCNRFNTLERKSRETLVGDHGAEGRFFVKTDSLRQKLEDNKKRAYERERYLKENLRLQELLNDFVDIDDWMSEKLVALNQVTLTSKRDVSNAYSQVKALQEEIEASRERAEGVIETGKQLIDSCPWVSRIVSVTIDNIYAHWEALLKELHKQMLSLEELHREYFLNRTVQDLLRWAEKLLFKVKIDIEDFTLTTAGLTELQKRLDAHQRDCQNFENHSGMAAVIREHSESLSQRYPDRAADLAAVNTEVDRQLCAVNAALAQREDLLNLHITVTSHLLDLNSELLWVKDKLVQIRQPYNDWTPQDRWSVGKHLLRVQQENRRLMNHIAEVENRGPRVKALCIRAKETYLGTSEDAAQRVGSFREVLGELEQAWYTVTHMLEVRREELRLTEAIHKFFFDVVNMEAWISERELYLQSICEPTNIEEANRSLRRLNLLHEAVEQWSNEVTKTNRRANELCTQLSSGVQINGNYVIAPPAAKSAVATAMSQLVEDFARLENSVRDCRKDLFESISLHDVLQDINDLEDWIAERQKTAKDSDVGTDLEHTFNLKDRFDQFAKCTRKEGERRVKAMLLRIDQIIAKGHKNRSEIALARDGLNEDWVDLLEMITTRGQLLKSALTLYRFFSDAQYLEKQIEEFYQYLPEEPTVEMVTDQSTSIGGRSGGIASLLRRQAGLQQRLSHLNSSCAALAATAVALLPTYSGEEEVRLRLRLDCVLSAAQSLAATAEMRARQLEEAQHFHRFFSTAHNLITWFVEAKNKMSQPNGLSRTIYGVERLIAEHRQLHVEMGIKVKQVEECLDVGRAILGIGNHSITEEASRPARSRLHAVLTAPQGEVRETCVALATERILIEALWRERWERLGMLLDVRYYMRDAAAAESWLVSREVYLVSVRRNIGETLAETLALLGAHYAFERACNSAEERFAALKQLTKMEIHALEWKPEDASRHEKQRRDNIRRAVHEFLPSPDNLTRLPPQAPQPISSRGQFVSVVAPFERASGVTRAVPIPQKCTSRASLPTVAVPKSTLFRREEPPRPFSSSSTADIFFPRMARVTSPKNPSDDPVTSTTPFEEAGEGKTLETTSSTRPQGSFPSTSANTPPPETRAEAAKPETAPPASTKEMPRIEGPLIRKWESEAGGMRHSRGRGWTSIYATLMDGRLTFYRDRRTRRERVEETYHGEAPLDLSGAIAVPALDYTKRPFVFRLRLFTGAEYLFQAVSAEVLQRWVDSINDSASKLTQKELRNPNERAHSLPPSSRHSRASSAASGQCGCPQHTRFHLLHVCQSRLTYLEIKTASAIHLISFELNAAHVELSSNEATQFKARELKSVHVDAYGSYFQIFLYKNFANPENLYNQISVIALNLVGCLGSISGNSAPNGNRVDDINMSPVDDLAFGIYQDPHLGNIIRRLQCQKLEYARRENFDMAGKARDVIRYIQQVSEKLCRLEFEKKEAVKLENYEDAKVKKEQIIQIRDELARNSDLDALLSADLCLQHNSRSIMSSNKLPTSFQHGVHYSNESVPETDIESCFYDSTASCENAFPAQYGHNVADERPLPALQRKQTKNSAEEAIQLEENYGSPTLDNECQGLSEATTRQAAVAIDFAGLPLVQLFYSRSWKLREQALVDLERRVSQNPLPPPVSLESMSSEPDPVGELRSTTFLLLKALSEQVLTLYRKALEMIQSTIVDFGERHHIAKPEVFTSLDKVVRLLLQRTGDSSLRVRDITKAQLVGMAKWSIFRKGGGFWHEILRPFQPTTLERLALCQMQIVSNIYADSCGSGDKGESGNAFPLIEDLVTFTIQALEHRSNEVRELAESLIVALYRSEDRNLVRHLMPPNDWEAQRHPLYRRIFAKFDKLDGRDRPSDVLLPSRKVPQKRHDEQTAPKHHRRIRCQTPLPTLKNGTTSRESPTLVANKSSSGTASPAATNSELDLLLSLDKTCIFCGEQNDDFTEEALDMHYWKTCPMLRRCPNCKQVVEVSGLTEHLLNECPKSGKLGGYRRCEVCSEAIPNATFITHNSCKAAPDPSLRCPLCHADLADDGIQGSNNEDAWRMHLMRECRQNSRISRPPPSSDPAIQGPSIPPAVPFPSKKAIVKRVNI